LLPSPPEQVQTSEVIIEPVQIPGNASSSVDEEGRQDDESNHHTASPVSTLLLQKPQVFRMIPMLALDLKTGTRRVDYRIQTEHWQQLESQDISDYPTTHIADSFEGGQLFEFSDGSGLFGLVINIQSMPLHSCRILYPDSRN
jgi:hypothetical protein